MWRVFEDAVANLALGFVSGMNLAYVWIAWMKKRNEVYQNPWGPLYVGIMCLLCSLVLGWYVSHAITSLVSILSSTPN